VGVVEFNAEFTERSLHEAVKTLVEDVCHEKAGSEIERGVNNALAQFLQMLHQAHAGQVRALCHGRPRLADCFRSVNHCGPPVPSLCSCLQRPFLSLHSLSRREYLPQLQLHSPPARARLRRFRSQARLPGPARRLPAAECWDKVPLPFRRLGYLAVSAGIGIGAIGRGVPVAGVTVASSCAAGWPPIGAGARLRPFLAVGRLSVAQLLSIWNLKSLRLCGTRTSACRSGARFAVAAAAQRPPAPSPSGSANPPCPDWQLRLLEELP